MLAPFPTWFHRSYGVAPTTTRLLFAKPGDGPRRPARTPSLCSHCPELTPSVWLGKPIPNDFPMQQLFRKFQDRGQVAAVRSKGRRKMQTTNHPNLITNDRNTAGSTPEW